MQVGAQPGSLALALGAGSFPVSPPRVRVSWSPQAAEQGEGLLSLPPPEPPCVLYT